MEVIKKIVIHLLHELEHGKTPPNSHAFFTPNSSFIWSRHFSSYSSNAALRSLSCKTCFLLSKLAYNSTWIIYKPLDMALQLHALNTATT